MQKDNGSTQRATLPLPSSFIKLSAVFVSFQPDSSDFTSAKVANLCQELGINEELLFRDKFVLKCFRAHVYIR